MSPFEHYMYVLRCGDGSLYTGYTTDVSARVAAHQTGKGAKFTKAHAPVELIAQARFYSKERAMSAEAYFKQLSRPQKDSLLAQAESIPFEEVLCSELSGFGRDTAREFVNRCLCEKTDPSFREYAIKRNAQRDPRTIVGVRAADLRAIAKALVKRDDRDTYLQALPHALFEQDRVHLYAIKLEKDPLRAAELRSRFEPYLDDETMKKELVE